MTPRSLGLTALLGCAALSSAARAGPSDVLLLPVREPELRAPVDLGPVSRRLRVVLEEAARDFGLHPLDVASPPVLSDSEIELVGWEPDSWVLAPTLGWWDGELGLRLVIRGPGSRVLAVRQERVTPAGLDVTTLGMLKDLWVAVRHDATAVPAPGLAPSEVEPEAAEEYRSEGSAVLAFHTAALGAYLGFSLQRASGSNDARLTYPLAALGAGVGLGASVVVSEEWDIGVEHAWYLGAGMLWPGLGTLLALEARDLRSANDQYILGLLGAVGGLSLATVGLSLGDVGEGGAALTHSGGSMGLLLGGLAEMAIAGDAERKPSRGMGVGAIGGSLIAGAVASLTETPPSSDLLFVDLSALLGGLAGAAVGTPVLVSQDRSEARDRIWISGVLVGTMAGAGLGYWLTQRSEGTEALPAASRTVALRAYPGHPGGPLGISLQGSW